MVWAPCHGYGQDCCATTNMNRGGMVIWRTVLWHPDLVSHVFSVCTPYTAPSKTYVSTETLVKGPAPQFGYQLQLASGEVEPKISSREDIRQFLRGMYGGRGPNGEVVFSPQKGVLFENIPKVGPSPIISDKVRPVAKDCCSGETSSSRQEIDYYADQWSRTGLHGPCKLQQMEI